MSSSAASMESFICLDAFAMRQFKATDDKSSAIIAFEPAAFLAKCRELIAEKQSKGETVLVDGYAPFCKHIFVPNFTPSLPTAVDRTSLPSRDPPPLSMSDSGLSSPSRHPPPPPTPTPCSRQ